MPIVYGSAAIRFLHTSQQAADKYACCQQKLGAVMQAGQDGLSKPRQVK